MKKILLTLSTAVFTLSAIAQTAPDFTATDCNGTSHNLYTELSGGNVVILNWVMPCGACIAPSQTAYNAAQSFAITNPGKVKYFLYVDDKFVLKPLAIDYIWLYTGRGRIWHSG